MVILALIFLGASLAPGPLAPSFSVVPPYATTSDSIEEFAGRLLELLQARHSIDDFRFDAGEGALVSDERKVSINLVNIHAEYVSRSGKDQFAYLDNAVVGLAKAVQGSKELALEEVRERLYPKVWLTSTLASMELENSGFGSALGERFATLPRWQLGQHLTAVLAIDFENTSRAVRMDEIERWGVPVATLCSEAAARLAETEMPWAAFASPEDSASTVLMPADEGGLDYLVGRLVALPGSVPVPLPDGSMALAAARSTLTLFVPGDSDLETLLLKGCFNEEDLPYPLQPLPLILKDGVWTNWSPPVDHPMGPELRELERRFLGGLYGQQKNAIEALQERWLAADEGSEALEALPPDDRIPVEFVASFQMLQRKEGAELESAAIWTSDVDSLLPKVDVVVLNQDDEQIFAPWRVVERVMGDSFAPVPHSYPVRYRPSKFPSNAQWKKIQRLSK